MNRLKYKSIEITGHTLPENIETDILLNFQDNSIYKPTSINIEGQIGFKAAKLVYGGTFINGTFLNSLVIRHGKPYIYAGLLFEINSRK